MVKKITADHSEGEVLLSRAAALHEIGLSISRSAYHKHSAYITSHADMPGFSRTDQARLAALVLGHVGKLDKLEQAYPIDKRLLFCLRLAVLLYRRRADVSLPSMQVMMVSNGYQICLPKKWIEDNPLTGYSLAQEAVEWKKMGYCYQIIYTD